jgi:hypothetical protein
MMARAHGKGGGLIMRVGTVPGATLVVAILLGTLGAAGAGAQTATPTATDVSGSTITVRFVRDMQPVSVGLSQSLTSFEADGVSCPIAIQPAVGEYFGFSTGWPMIAGPSVPEPCSQGPPTSIRIEFPSEFGPLIAEFVWEGGDVLFDLPVPPELAVTTTPSVAATALPETGTRTTGDNRTGALLATIAGLAALTALGGALVMRRRSH